MSMNSQWQQCARKSLHYQLKHWAFGFVAKFETCLVAGSFRVSLELKEGVHSILGIQLGTFMLSRPTLSCSDWWEFVCTKCHHDVVIS